MKYLHRPTSEPISTKFIFGDIPKANPDKLTTNQVNTTDSVNPSLVGHLQEEFSNESNDIYGLATPETPISYSLMNPKDIDTAITYLSRAEDGIPANEIRTIDLKISDWADATPDKMFQLMDLAKGRENISLQLTINGQSLPSNVLQDMYHDQEIKLTTPQEKIEEITNKEMTLREKARQTLNKATAEGHTPSLYSFNKTFLVKAATIQMGKEYIENLLSSKSRYAQNPIDVLEDLLKTHIGINSTVNSYIENLANGQAGYSNNVALAEQYTKKNYKKEYDRGQRAYVYTRSTPMKTINPETNTEEAFAIRNSTESVPIAAK